MHRYIPLWIWVFGAGSRVSLHRMYTATSHLGVWSMGLLWWGGVKEESGKDGGFLSVLAPTPTVQPRPLARLCRERILLVGLQPHGLEHGPLCRGAHDNYGMIIADAWSSRRLQIKSPG